MSGWAIVAVLAGLSPIAAAVLAHAWDRRDPVDTVVSALGAVAGSAVLIRVAADGPVAFLDGGFVIDRVGAAWAVFALIVLLAIRTFARRQLASDASRERFHVLGAVAGTSGIALFWAGNLAVLGATAVVSSLAASALVGSSSRNPAVGRRMVNTLLAADALLVAGLVIVMLEADRGAGAGFGVLGEVDGPALHLAAVAVVAAALVRCAQVPVQGWLPRTLVAPTPASALLHAGLVNAGGVLLIRLAPLVAASLVATLVGVALATASIVLGAAAMRSRIEVKTALVWSTTAQMGFMLVQVLIGLGAAAAAHLIAHGAYKSNLFLASGSTIEHAPYAGPGRGPAHRAWSAGIAAVLVAVALVVSGYDLGAHDGTAFVVPAFALFTVYAVLAGPAGVVRGPSASLATSILGLGGALTAYLYLLGRFESWLDLPAPTPSGGLVIAVGVVVAVLTGAFLSAEGAGVPARIANPLRARILAQTRRPTLDVARLSSTGASR